MLGKHIYGFHRVTRSDLPMLEAWLKTPDVKAWWGDPAHELALIEEDMDNSDMVQLIGMLDGRPLAYLQHYEVHAWPQKHLEHLPRGARAIDMFVGVPSLIGKGHGTALLSMLARQLAAQGVRVLCIDPDPHNSRARAAYGRAGFVEQGVLDTPEGPAVLMFFEPPPET
ncbi:GNAT family N-acetyltransferase [Blastomonas sp.]|uniref:GNAT family N-acetyltransferase n=1 Tax=Blastomonas sp. TaxID=1909299 RepID=UPI003592F945